MRAEEKGIIVFEGHGLCNFSNELVNGGKKLNSGTTLFNNRTGFSSTCCWVEIDALRDNWSFQRLF
jgi:hypothetical protein